MRRTVLAVAIATSLFALSSPAAAVTVKNGDICVLSKELQVKYQTARGWALLPVKEEREIDILTVGEEGVLVRAGRIEGLVDRGVLERSCKSSARRCQVLEIVEISERSDGEGRQWRIKPGAIIDIDEEREGILKVSFSRVSGYVGASVIETSCSVLRARYPDDDIRLADTTPAPKPVVKQGAKILFAPFTVGPGLTAVHASLFEDKLAEALKIQRGDVSGPGDRRPNTAQRQVGLKQHLKDLRAVAKEAGVSTVITGQLTRPGQKTAPPSKGDADDDEGDVAAPPPEDAVLLLAVFDVETGKVTKTVQVNPRLKGGYRWAEPAIDSIKPVLPAETPAKTAPIGR